MNEVMTFYQFAALIDLDDLEVRLQAAAEERGLKGTVLLASEGINGTLSGPRVQLESFADLTTSLDGLELMPFKYSTAAPGSTVFYRLKVRIKAEIVALGKPEFDRHHGHTHR